MGLFGFVGNALGVGDVGQTKHKATPYKVNTYEFNDPYRDQNQAMLQQGLASRMGVGTPRSQFATAQGATIDPAQQAMWRNQQMGLAGALQQQSMGQGPSIAQMQLQRGLDSSIAAQRAQAASARGMSPGMAQRLAAQGIGAQTGQAANDAAMLRMQEQMQARQQLAGVLSDARGADIGMATNQANLGQALSLANAQNQQQSMLANQQAALEAQRQKDAMAQYYTGAGLNIDQNQFNANMSAEQAKMQAYMASQGINAQIAQGNAQAQANVFGSLIGGAGAAASTIISDERAKENIKPAGKDLGKFLDALKAQSFDYKKPEHGGKDYYGFMAQDAERSRVGKSLVIETPDGTKAIDLKRLTMALTASAAHMNERLRKLERGR